MGRKENAEELIRQFGEDILNSYGMNIEKNCMQHGSISVYEHSLMVAALCVKIAVWCNIRADMRALIRGALLHDYFLYDWHDKDHISPFRLHGFFHPGIALKNAEKEYRLSSKERDIIRKHMWPLTIVPPTCREAWVVSMADKYCSLMETLRIHRKHKGE